jgi:hypothetical protein
MQRVRFAAGTGGLFGVITILLTTQVVLSGSLPMIG